MQICAFQASAEERHMSVVMNAAITRASSTRFALLNPWKSFPRSDCATVRRGGIRMTSA
jgi:hypothetical protein